MQRHYLSLVYFEDFIRPAFKLCCEIMGKDPNNYQLEFDHSMTPRFGLFTFPNKITLYVNTLVYIGDSDDANKTFIIHTIFHELVHSTQDLIKSNPDELELVADQLAIKYITDNQRIIQMRLKFMIDSLVLDLYRKSIQEYNYIKASEKYTYLNILKRIIPKVFKIDYDELFNNDSLILTIDNKKDNTFETFVIKSLGEFYDPTPLINYLTRTVFQYNRTTSGVKINGYNVYLTITDYIYHPILYTKGEGTN